MLAKRIIWTNYFSRTCRKDEPRQEWIYIESQIVFWILKISSYRHDTHVQPENRTHIQPKSMFIQKLHKSELVFVNTIDTRLCTLSIWVHTQPGSSTLWYVVRSHCTIYHFFSTVAKSTWRRVIEWYVFVGIYILI
jgi:hypothetical protein